MQKNIGLTTPEVMRDLVAIRRRLARRGALPRANPKRGRMQPTIWKFKFIAPEGGIPAATATTAGRAEVEVLFGELDGTTGDVTFAPSGEMRTIYSWADIVVCDQGSRRGTAILHEDLLYWVDSETCPPGSDDDGDDGDSVPNA